MFVCVVCLCLFVCVCVGSVCVGSVVDVSMGGWFVLESPSSLCYVCWSVDMIDCCVLIMACCD